MSVTERLESASRFWIAWWALGIVALVGLVVVPLILDVSGGVSVPRFNRWLVEVWLVTGLVALVVRRLRPFDLWNRTQKVVFTGLAVGVLVAQLSPISLPIYPFSDWAMYTEPAAEVPYPAFVMLADGAEVGHLPIADLVPNVLGREIMDRFGELSVRAEEGDTGAEQAITKLLHRLLDAHGDPDVDAVEARSCLVAGTGIARHTDCRTVLVVQR
ncbi:hypothetical protein [Egicoccus sp. AB-alg2]|uniref:hypothetical protein n=1 Tax=Egicoccus sp. AB-alg2 TaxID=3242693 RepID=UPI00359E4DB6